jgi:hypothetical protein
MFKLVQGTEIHCTKDSTTHITVRVRCNFDDNTVIISNKVNYNNV